MFQLRRSALRLLSSSTTSSLSLLSKPRAISSLSASSIKSRTYPCTVTFQRRWATSQAEAEAGAKDDEVVAKENEIEVKEGEEHSEQSETVPINQTEASTEAEVENVLSQEQATEETQPAAAAVFEAKGATAASPNASSASPYTTSKRAPSSPKPTVYVGNLFFDVTEDDLTKEFSRFGQVNQTRIIRDARGLSKGFGYVDFKTTEEATEAIQALHQQLFEGRRIVCQYATFESKDLVNGRPGGAAGRTFNRDGATQNPPSKTLFIGNMSFEMTDQDLNSLFRNIKNVIDVRVAIDRRTGQPRGFAHADFIDVQSAIQGFKELQGREIYGRRLRLDYSYASSSAPRNQPPPESSSR